MTRWLDTLGDALAALPRPPDEPWTVRLRNASMHTGLYAPRGIDDQQPHDQDELYVIAAGTAGFRRQLERVAVGPGDVLFVPAGMPHAFEGMSEDFAAWAIFWGPPGGEQPPGG